MSTAWMIRLQIGLIVLVVLLAGFDVARFYDLLVQGWPSLTSVLAIMIGGKTVERMRERRDEDHPALAQRSPSGETHSQHAVGFVADSLGLTSKGATS